MNNVAEQFAATQKANLEAFTGLSHKAFTGFEKLVELNLAAGKAVMAESLANLQALSSAKDPQAFVTLQSSLAQPLAENDAARREQIWQLLDSSELKLFEQFNRFAAAFAKVAEADARVSKLPVGLPFADKLFPAATFDMRKVLQIHAQAITQAAQNSLGRTPKGKAFALSAELFLMQHSCHWFCKSKTVASARLLMRHKTSYEQVLASVAPDTRQAYNALVGA